jgi:hypothetical protein
MNNDRRIILTIAAISLLLTASALAPFLDILPTTNATSNSHGRQQCDPSVTICKAGTTGSSQDLRKKEQQGREPVAHAQTAPTKPEDNGLTGSDNRGTGGDTIVKAPIATSGNNIYIVWWDNKTGNDEVMFKSSTDGGKTFGDKINLSNSTNSDSQDAQIDTFGDNDTNVIVTWWERNATSSEPVTRISTDSGKTFGPIVNLSTNGTIGK